MSGGGSSQRINHQDSTKIRNFKEKNKQKVGFPFGKFDLFCYFELSNDRKKFCFLRKNILILGNL